MVAGICTIVGADQVAVNVVSGGVLVCEVVAAVALLEDLLVIKQEIRRTSQRLLLYSLAFGAVRHGHRAAHRLGGRHVAIFVPAVVGRGGRFVFLRAVSGTVMAKGHR